MNTYDYSFTINRPIGSNITPATCAAIDGASGVVAPDCQDKDGKLTVNFKLHKGAVYRIDVTTTDVPPPLNLSTIANPKNNYIFFFYVVNGQRFGDDDPDRAIAWKKMQ